MKIRALSIAMLASAGASLLNGCAHHQKPAEAAPAPQVAPQPVAKPEITIPQVNAAQQTWCDGLLAIAKANAQKGDYKTIANKVLSEVYNYDHGSVLFNPTLTFGDQNFRLDREGAAAYFIGGNPKFPNDKGFALKPWVGCRYTNAGVLIDGDYAFTMGNVVLTDSKNKETTVDKFFAFKRSEDGKLRIVVHKSSLPFNPK